MPYYAQPPPLRHHADSDPRPRGLSPPVIPHNLGMKDDTFWVLIDRVRHEYDELDDQCTFLGETLRQLSPSDCRQAGLCFDRVMQRAYNWPLWGAAFIIGGGCSDDLFTDFRASLIMRGKTIFETALRNPDTLADLVIPKEWWFFEGFQYEVHEAVDAVMDDLNSNDLSDGPESREDDETEPTGEEWSENELANLLPRLFAKYADQ